jgi:hypothetical protein
VFEHKSGNAVLTTDAYRGRDIKQATHDFLEYAAGKKDAKNISANLVVYIGHDGFMDFTLDDYPAQQNTLKRDAVILACLSQKYFTVPLRKTGATPLLWTTGLMAPEAYILDAALNGWLKNETGEQIRKRAAQAYHTYQKCGLNAAMRLFTTGWKP